MDPEGLRAHVELLSNVNVVLNRRQLHRCYRIGHAIAAHCRQLASEAIAAHDGRPVLQVYISDGWSAKVRGDVKAHIGGDHVVRRIGHFRHEFLLERGLVKMRDANGAERFHMLFGAPRGLRLGKTSWNVLTAASEFSSMLRASGHHGLAVSVYIQDGMLHSASMRLFKARHALYYDCMAAAGEESDPLDKHRDLVVGVRCKAHGLHNSLPWGLGRHHSAQIVDDAFIVLASLLNCSSAIHERVDLFVLRSVKFVPRANDPDDVASFWRALDVNDSMLPLFVELDPFWNGSNLEVAHEAEEDPEFMDKVSTLVMYGFRWVQWSTSRWCKAGRSGRFFMRSLALGIDGAVQECFQDPDCSTSLLNGYTRCMSTDVRQMLGMVAFTGRCAEPLLLKLLGDDRFLRNAASLNTMMQESLGDIARTRPFIWQRLGALVGVSACDIRHSTILAAAATVGYINRDVFGDLRAEPLSLTQGNIEDNVASLARREGEIQDPTARQLRVLLDAGELQAHIVDALVLLRDCPCTSTLVEEGHASAAVLKRYHEDYSEAVLRCRALLHQQRALLRPSPIQKKLTTIDRRVERLQSRQPEKVHSRQCLLKQSVEQALSQREDADPLERKRVSRGCMVSLAAHMDGMTREERQGLRHDAAELRAALKRNIDDDIVKNQERRRELVAEQRANDTEGVRNHVGSARLSEQDVQAICDMLNTELYQSMELDESGTAGSAPAPPLPEQVKLFQQKASEMATPARSSPLPWWCRIVCPHRVHFHGVALAKGQADPPVYWLVLFAKQQPYQVTFLSLRPRPRILELSGEEEGLGQHDRSAEHVEFDYLPPVVREEWELGFDEGDDILCLAGIRMQGDYASTSHEPEPLENFMARLPAAKQPKEQRTQPPAVRKSIRLNERDALLREFTWLTEEDLPGGGPRRKRARPAEVPGDAEQDLSDDGDEADVHEPVAEAAADDVDLGSDEPLGEAAPELELKDDGDARLELAAVRAEWSWEQQDVMNFYTRVIGGAWMKREFGVAADSVSGFPRAWLLDWCNVYAWPVSARFSFTRFGRAAAHQLCREWCRRSEHFYRVWLEAEVEGFEFTQAEVDDYTEDMEWLNFMIAQPPESPAFARGVQIRRLIPRLGPAPDDVDV